MSKNTISSQRTSRLRKNIFGSFLAKGWSAVVVLLMVPVTLKCLGEYTNGVWLTISSLLIWIESMDIGLGNGLRNQLAVYLAHDNQEAARMLVSSAFAMLACIMLPIIVILTQLVAMSDTYGFLNVDPSLVTGLDEVLSLTVILVCITFVFKLTGNFYMGLQLPAVSNMMTALGQTVALVATWGVYLAGSHSLKHIALAYTVGPLIVYLAAYVYTFYYRFPHLRPSLRQARLSEGKAVMKTGIQFFIIQVASVVLFTTTNILISKLFSPAMVTPYQITYRYFSLMLAVFTVICMPYWNATTDAFERGDIEWIRHATRRLRLMTAAILGCMIVMVAVSPLVYHLWIGDEVTIDIRMSMIMALYIFILIYSMRYSFFINGIGKLRLQLIFTSLAALSFIPLAYLVADWTHDIICFISVMCLVNLPGLVVNRIQFNRLVNGTARGIWNK